MTVVPVDSWSDGDRWVVEGVVVRDDDGRWHLRGSECVACGTRYFADAPVCQRCLGLDLKPILLADTGTVYSATTIVRGRPNFLAPYDYAWIDLDDGPRVFGHLIGTDGNARAGDRVRLTAAYVREEEDGAMVAAHAFEPEGKP